MVAAVTAAALMAAGWTTGLRHVMHGALLTLAIAALLPLVLIAGGLLVIMLIGFIVALPAALAGGDAPVDGLDGAGEAVVEGGGWLFRRYYGFLARQRHPVFWGVPAGLLLGGLLIWALIAALVIPGETRTVHALTDAKANIERVYRESGGFPQPDQQGHLPLAAIGAAEPGASGVLEDGFGRPFTYAISGRWKLASWTLTSSGFDRETGADDLCLHGSTRLLAWAERAKAVARLSLDGRLAGIRALRCPGE